MQQQQSYNFKELLTCKVCNKYLKDPVALPCEEIAQSVCKEHVDQYIVEKDANSYDCQLCNQKHVIPENGFPLNEYAIGYFQMNLHLDEKSKEASELIDKLGSSLNELAVLNNDPDNYVFNHISEIINKIDLERERLIAQIHEKSDDMINKLKAFREECKANLHKLDELIEQNKVLVEELEMARDIWKEELRIPDLDQKLVDEMITNTKELLEDNKYTCTELKIRALNGKDWSFSPKNLQINNDTFGELKFVCSEATFQFVINEFSKFKESNDLHYSPSCKVANLPWKISAGRYKPETTTSCCLECYLNCNKDDKSRLVFYNILFFNHFK